MNRGDAEKFLSLSVPRWLNPPNHKGRAHLTSPRS